MSLKTLKNKLAEYVRLAAAGETVLVTDRDRVVAELAPPRPGRAAKMSDAVTAELVRQGWMTPAAAPSDSPPPRLPVASLDRILAGLDEDRRER